MKTSYLIKKVLMMVLIFAIVLIINFLLPRLSPVDPAQPYYPSGASEELKQEIRASLGYDGTMWEQFGTYFSNFFKGEFGDSIKYNKPVFQVIGDHITWTLALTVTGLIINATIGIIIGAYCATKRGKRADNTLLGAASITTAIPAFWIAMVLVLIFGYTLAVFPTGGRLSDELGNWQWQFKYIFDLLYHMILPLISTGIGGVIGYAMTTRNATIAVTNEDYIMTAKAKGLSGRRVLYRHTLRNALLPLVTSIGMSMSGLIGGAVIIERIFSWNGMGTLFVEANASNDYNLMLAIMLLMSAITLVANFVVDLLYVVLDPRIKEVR